jgi:hypothetical protein
MPTCLQVRQNNCTAAETGCHSSRITIKDLLTKQGKPRLYFLHTRISCHLLLWHCHIGSSLRKQVQMAFYYRRHPRNRSTSSWGSYPSDGILGGRCIGSSYLVIWCRPRVSCLSMVDQDRIPFKTFVSRFLQSLGITTHQFLNAWK